MSGTALISIICEDHSGLIAEVTGRLFDLGINLGDTTFAVLGGGAEFTLVAKLPQGIALPEVEKELRTLPLLKDAKLAVTTFQYRESHDAQAHITHRVEITGDDSPGLVARLSEALPKFGAFRIRCPLPAAHGDLGAAGQGCDLHGDHRQHRLATQPQMPLAAGRLIPFP